VLDPDSLYGLWNSQVHRRGNKSSPWILSWAISSQSSSRTPTSRRSLLILSSQRRLGLPNGLLPSGLPTRIEYNLRFFFIRATWPAHLSRRDFIIFTSGESYSPWSSSLCSLLTLQSSRPVSARISLSKRYFQTHVICVHLLGSYYFRNHKVLPAE